MEVANDLHQPIWKQRKSILLDERLTDSFKLSELELRAEMVKNRVAVG